MTLVKRKIKAKVSTKSKRNNPNRDFKQDLENLVGERVTIKDKHGIFSAILKKDTRKDYYISITDISTRIASNAFISFKPSDVESIFIEDKLRDITLN